MNDLNLLVLVSLHQGWTQIERWNWPIIPGGTGIVFTHYCGEVGYPIEDEPWKLQRILDDLETTGYTERQIGEFQNIKSVLRLN